MISEPFQPSKSAPPDPGAPTFASVGHDAPWAKIAVAPQADWVINESYDAGLSGKEGDHVTQLLLSQQVHAGSGQSYHCTAVRLETSLAVQHESQWSLQLDPCTRRLTLHWLRVVRDGVRIDHLHRDRMRLVQRETQLERLVIDGVWTLLVVLEDVRPGDVLEAAFTSETAHPIRPGPCEVLFAVPPQRAIGRFRFSVLSSPAHPKLAWKASADAPKYREERLPDGLRRWTWEGAQLTPREPEFNQPSSFMDYVWVQVSDLARWRDLTTRATETWATMDDVAGLEAYPAFTRPARVDENAVVGLIQHIQDEFRYLSLDLEAGGWIPAAPAVVARRRFGDCKDLTWMAAVVLRRWGLSARPVLVGSGLRETIAELLPMTILFNHAVLEVEVAGNARWFDLTERAQGGNFAGRFITWFGYGLQLDKGIDSLRAQPGERPHGVFDWKETILLDTRFAKPSLVEHRIRAEGWQADVLREARQAHGAEAFVKEREKLARRRYGKIQRVGTLEWRDDRPKNVCELVEIFEIRDAVYSDETGQRALFDVPPNLISQSIPVPSDKPRRSPWALPFPLEICHDITVKTFCMDATNRRRRQWKEDGFIASLDEPRTRGAWSKITRLTVTEPLIEAAQLPVYRKHLDKFLWETSWRIYLPMGLPGMRRPNGFGELDRPLTGPAAARAAAVTLPVPRPRKDRSRPPSLPVAEDELKKPSNKNHPRQHASSTMHIPPWVLPVTLFVLLVIAFALTRYLDR